MVYGTKSFIEKARLKHGDKYDYSQVRYIKGYMEVKIICPIHGEFLQTPRTHLNGGVCKLCDMRGKHNNHCGRRKLTTEEFVSLAKQTHNNKYDYSQTIYVDSETKVKIVCPIHGIFEQNPSQHTRNKCGCPKCKGDRFRETIKKFRTTELFIELANIVHGDRYDYSISNYVSSTTPVRIRCWEHGVFEQTPASHINVGCGCPECGKYLARLCSKMPKNMRVKFKKLMNRM